MPSSSPSSSFLTPAEVVLAAARLRFFFSPPPVPASAVVVPASAFAASFFPLAPRPARDFVAAPSAPSAALALGLALALPLGFFTVPVPSASASPFPFSAVAAVDLPPAFGVLGVDAPATVSLLLLLAFSLLLVALSSRRSLEMCSVMALGVAPRGRVCVSW